MNALVAGIRAAAWWMVPAVLLACAIGWETDWGRAVRKPLPADEPIAPKPVETALLPEYTIAGGVGARTETTSRTLFNPTRRPAPAVADASRGRLQRGQFALTGTAVVEGKSTAFLRETTGGKSRRVQQGETINGVLVAEVKPDRVRLTLGDESEDLILKVATNPRPTPQPTPTPTAPGAPAAPTTAGAPVAPAGQAAPTPAAVPQGIPQSLAERRRAARAAAGDAAAAGAMPPTGAAAPVAPVAPTTPTVPTAAPGTLDPRWGEMDQRYRDAAPKRGNVR